jgi:hypothetical protein
LIQGRINGTRAPKFLSDGVTPNSAFKAIDSERIADLSTNIGEDVIFTVEGKLIKHGS